MGDQPCEGYNPALWIAPRGRMVQTMKIVTFNLRHDADRWTERRSLIVQALSEQNADLIAFQEVAIPIRQAHEIAHDLNAAIGGQPYAVHVQPKGGDERLYEGIAILTKLPAVEVDAIDLPGGNRVAQRIRVIWDGKPLNLINTHLHHLPEEDESIRAPQMRAILAWIAALAKTHREDRWVIVGDLNAQPHSETIQHAVKVLRSAYLTVHGSEPFTFPTPLVTNSGELYPPMAIDYVFFDPAFLNVISAELVGTMPAKNDPTLYPSDHFGIAAELTLK